MILPIGNTGAIRRLPYISLMLIIINTVIFFAMQPMIMRDNDIVYQNYSEYLNLVALNMEIKGMDSFDSETLLKEFENPTIIEGDSLYDELKFAKEKFDESNRNHAFSKFGVSKSNLSIQTLFTSMFIHSDIFHLISNLWFLFLLGFNVEDIYGRINYLIFYILSGIISSFIFVASTSQYPQISLIGASGAISGVMGAFFVKLYKTKIKFFYFLFPIRPFFGTFFIYAGFFLPMWFFQQIYESASNSSSGIAFIAHIGGFLFGAIISVILSATKIEEKFISPRVNESSNLLRMNQEEEDGVEAYLDENFEKAKNLLMLHFEKRKTFSVFVPLFVSFVKTNEIKKAQRVMDMHLIELVKKDENAKINEILEDIIKAGVFEKVSSSSKMVFAKRLRDSGDIDKAREIIKNVIEDEKFTIMGYKILIMAYEENVLFQGIGEIADEFLKFSNDDFNEIKQKLIRRKNEKR